MQFRKTSLALAAMTLCGAAQAAPSGLSFRAPTNNATISGNIYQSSACELTGSGIARVDFYLGSTLLNREGSAPWNCNIDTRKFSDGAYALRAVAYDSGGGSASTQISVNIKNNTSSTPYSGTPIALPGSFAAADFDKGGQNVAYRDLTSGNAGGQYRKSEDVDIVASGDSARPYAVNGFQTGEWLAYSINVPASGKYDIALRAGHNYASTPAFHIEVGGVDVTGKVNVPKTGGWSTYQWVGKQGVDLPAGQHVLKVVSDAEYFNLVELRVLAAAASAPAPAPSYSGTPFLGTPIALPKAFAAAHFDKGGQGVAYHDLTAGNAGGQYRTSEDVDIIAVSGSALSPYAVNSFHTGEWLAYTVNVPSNGKYDIAVNAASGYASTSAFRVMVDGVDVTGKVSVPNTGGWSTFKWVGKQGVDLAAGKRVLKVISDAQYFNLNGVSVLASAVTAPSTPPPSTSAPLVTAPSTPPPSTSAPLVSFKAPVNGQTVSKTLSGSACEALAANGTTAIKQVQFFVDGALLNTEGSAPWNCSFDTSKVKDGTRVLRAVATDVNGASGNSEISVNVANGTTSVSGPSNVAFAAPKSGATISSDIYQSSACELTGTGISRVEFFLSGKALNTEGGAPWNCNIAVKDHASGTHKLKAIAYNSSGGSTVAEIDVNIQNGSSTSTSSSGNPSFSCSFESSPTDCGFTEQAKEPGRATLVSSAREGIRGVRLYTKSGDNNVSGSGTWERNDLRLTQAATDCSEGKVQWWGHSILFPSDYNLPNNGGVVMDFHHTGSSGQANFHVDAMSTGLRLRGYGGATVDSGRYQVELGPVVRNVWYDFVYHVKWSSGSDGYMHAWVNGVKKLTHYGPTLYAGMGCYLKLANYHDPMGKSSAVIHDRVRRGSKAEDVSLTPLP